MTAPGTVPQLAAPVRPSRRQRARTRAFYGFVSPWVLGFLALTIVPLGYSLLLSFRQVDDAGATTGYGFAYYDTALLHDPTFRRSVLVTLLYAAASTLLGLAVALAIALLLEALPHGSAILQSVVFFPAVAAGAGVFLLWGWMFGTNVGLINYGLSRLHIQGPGWLTQPSWALWSLIIMSLFFVGQQVVVFLAALRGVPRDYYEAARLDGASSWRLFRNVTLPLISPATFFNLIVMLIYSLQLFAQPYLMTKGGPARSTYSMGMYIYDTAFQYGRFNYASTLAWILFAITLLITLGVVASSRKWVHYDVA